jgi:hypothetical protein
MANKVEALIWKSEQFGTGAPAIAVRVAGGTYGVWSALFNAAGRATGAAYPIGSGRGLTEDEAIRGAKRANAGMGGPSATGDFSMGGVTG